MAATRHTENKLEDGNSEQRLLIEISNWDWPLHVGIAPRSLPEQERFQGGLFYARGIEIHGNVLAPGIHQGKDIRLHVLVLTQDMDFGPGGMREVGQLHERRDEHLGAALEAIIFIPQNALSTSVTCLASVWKFLHLGIAGDPLERASVIEFAFSRDGRQDV
jgi:hypothetical protein